MGPQPPPPTGLTREEEALIVTVRRHTLLPLDDGLSAWQATIPHPARSALHRRLKRHGISRLPAIAGDKPQKKAFKRQPLGSCHSAMADVRPAEGQLPPCGAIERTGKFADAELPADADRMVAAQFLRNLIATVPSKIHTV